MTRTSVFIQNLTGTQYFKVYHRVRGTYWDDNLFGLRIRSFCAHANGKALGSASRALIHIDYAKKFAKPCTVCYPDGAPS